MARLYRGHYLTEEKKQLASDNLPLVWWYLDKLISNNKIRAYESEEVTVHLMWHLCMSAESFDLNKGIKFSTYAMFGLKSGYHRYIQLREAFRKRFVTVAYGFENEDSSEYNPIFDPPYRSKRGTSWEEIDIIFNNVELDDIEHQIMFYYYRQGYNFYQIGNIFGLTKERIRQMHKSAISKLREYVKEQNYQMEDFLHEVW